MSHMVPRQVEAAMKWFAKAAMDGVIGLAVIPLVKVGGALRRLV